MSDSARRCVILNAFGAGNLGDDLLLKAALAVYGRHAVSLAVGFGPPRLRDSIPHMTYREFLNSRSARSALSACDYVFFGGGLFWSAENLATICALAAGHRSRGGNVDVIGVGLQGRGFDAGIVRVLAEVCRTFSVRDTTSASMITAGDWGPAVIEDPVFDLLKPTAPPRRRRSEAAPTIGLSLGGLDSLHDPSKLPHVIEILGTINHLYLQESRAQGPIQFLFIPHVRHIHGDHWSDVPVGEALAASKIGSLIDMAAYPLHAEDLRDAYLRCDVVLSNRFHGLVIPQALGIPAWGVDWDLDPTRSKVSARCADRAAPLFRLEDSFATVARAVADQLSSLWSSWGNG